MRGNSSWRYAQITRHTTHHTPHTTTRRQEQRDEQRCCAYHTTSTTDHRQTEPPVQGEPNIRMLLLLYMVSYQYTSTQHAAMYSVPQTQGRETRGAFARQLTSRSSQRSANTSRQSTYIRWRLNSQQTQHRRSLTTQGRNSRCWSSLYTSGMPHTLNKRPSSLPSSFLGLYIPVALSLLSFWVPEPGH